MHAHDDTEKLPYTQLREVLRLSGNIAEGDWESCYLDTDKHNLKKHAVINSKEYCGRAVCTRGNEFTQIALLPGEHPDRHYDSHSYFIACAANAIRKELSALLKERDALAAALARNNSLNAA